jgi:dihydrofolate reductase
MKVIAIAAVDKNGLIGNGDALPWNIPEDMQFFRDSTREQIVVMGRKTYQSLKKALPKRENGVITRDQEFKLPDARIFHSLSDALTYYRSQPELQSKTIFIIGGAEIYKLSITALDEIWLTEIDAEFQGDVYFPHYQKGKLNLTEFKGTPMHLQKDFSGSPFHYQFTRYTRV